MKVHILMILLWMQLLLTPFTDQEYIRIEVHVVVDKPADPFAYEPLNGTPTNITVFRYRLIQPLIPGSGVFEPVDSIPLEKAGEDIYVGEKYVRKFQGVMCLGFQPTNFIDGQAVVYVNQSLDTVKVTVHYWKVTIGILGRPPVAVLSNSIDWELCGRLLSSYFERNNVEMLRFTVDNASEMLGMGFIVILGGPDAYEGVGGFSARALPSDIEMMLRSNHSSYGVFEYFDVWRPGQHVIVIAGHDRYLTLKAVREITGG